MRSRLTFCSFSLLLFVLAVHGQTSITLHQDVGSQSHRNMLLVGDHLYVWDVGDPLYLYDVSDSSNPVLLSTIDAADPAFFADPIPLGGSLYYVEAGGQDHLYDFSTPASPVDLGAIGLDLGPCTSSTGGSIYLDATAQRLYSMCRLFGYTISAFDISTPQTPSLLWESPLPLNSSMYENGLMVVRGDYAYVTTYAIFSPTVETWFHRFDLSTPATPVSLGGVQTSYEGSGNHGVSIVDDTLFVQGASQLYSYSFGAAGAVTLLDQLTLSNAPARTFVHGTDLVMSTNGGVTRVDVSDPALLSESCSASWFTPADGIYHVVADGSCIYLARWNGGLRVRESDCTGPFTQLASAPIFNSPKQMVTIGDHAFVQTFNQIWSASLGYDGEITLLDAVEASDEKIFPLESGYVLQRGYLTDELDVFDVQDPHALQFVTTHDLNKQIYDGDSEGSLVVMRTYGQAGSPFALRMYDFSDPQAPQELSVSYFGGTATDDGKFSNVVFTGDVVYVGYENGVAIANAADPNNMVWVPSITTPVATADHVFLDVTAGNLVVSKNDLHQLWDLSSPLSPSYVSDLSIPTDGFYRFTSMGNLLLGAGPAIAAFDISTPAVPVFLAEEPAYGDGRPILKMGSAIMALSWDLNSYLVSSPTATPPGTTRSAILEQNQPNPFGSDTTIRLRSVPAGAYELKIYDVAGRLIRSWQGEAAPPQFRWNGRDEQGRAVASGVYYYEFSAGAHTESRRMVLRK